MALKDYEALDEDDFYGQPFEQSGFVSLWAGFTPLVQLESELDILQDCCGVGYYNPDQQEIVGEPEKCDTPDLISRLSYSQSFSLLPDEPPGEAYWILAQYDFRYDPDLVRREIASDPNFLGSFRYSSST